MQDKLFNFRMSYGLYEKLKEESVKKEIAMSTLLRIILIEALNYTTPSKSISVSSEEEE